MRSADHQRAQPPSIDYRYAPASRWTLLCHPDDPHKSLLREDGALLYDYRAAAFDTWHFDIVLEFSAQTTRPARRIAQATETARRPIVHTTIEYPDQTLELISFAHQTPGWRGDIVLWTLTAHVDDVMGGLHIDADLAGRTLAGAGPAPHHRLYALPAGSPAPTPDWTEGLPLAGAGLATSAPWTMISLGPPFLGASARGFRPVSGLRTMRVILRAGESARGAIVVPVTGPPGCDTLAWADHALATERAFWDALTVARLPLRVPDEEVQNLLIASARNMLQARETEDGLPVLHVGPTIYRGLWLVDGHFLLEAARYLGLDETADAGLEVLLRRVRPNGSITEIGQVPYLKETGVAISTIIRQAELTGDLDGLRRRWPIVRAAVGHIRGLHDRARELPPDHPLYGLMPEGFADGGIGGTRPEYTTVLWTLIGLRYALRGAELLGEHADAGTFRDIFDVLKDGFEKSAETHRRLSDDGAGSYLPMALPGSGQHQFLPGLPDDLVPAWRRLRPETATWAACHAIWPGEIFRAEDTIVTDLLALLDSRDDDQGIPATTGWLSYQAVWTYFASFAAHAWLYAGRPDKTIDYLYAFANHAAPTRAWREEQALTASGNDQVCGDMPHNWASAEFIRLVRHMLVFERGEDLHLLPAVPAHWLEAGKRIHAGQTPTRFGRIDLSVNADADAITVQIRRHTSPGSATPAQTVLHLPPAARRNVRANGQPVDLHHERHLAVNLASQSSITVEASR
jgi:hypothetical protein